MSLENHIHQLIHAQIDALLHGQAVEPISLDREEGSPPFTEEEQRLVESFNELSEKLTELKQLAESLGSGQLDCQTPRRNALASPLKQLHANLKHMAWQTKQVAQGDFSQQVDFLGEFAESFNSMTQSLRQKAIAEADLKKSERQYRIIFDQSPLGMAHVSLYGNFLLVNPAFSKLVGYPDESLLEMDLRQIVPDVYLHNYREMLQELFQSESDSSTLEIQYMPRDRDPIWVRINSTIIRDQHRPNPYVLSIVQDINQQKLLEQQVQDHNRLLEQLVESRTVELTEAKEIAEKADRVKSQFMANMSHELRTPINGIIGLAELAMNEEVESDEAFVGVLHESQALLSLVNSILDLSKIEAEQVHIEAIPFNLKTILDDLFTFFESTALKKGINLTIQISDKIPSRVIGDPLRLRQALAKLIENAIKFTHEGSVTVQITCLFRDDIHSHLRFAVEDTGIGIPEDKQQAIFRDFTQIDSKNTRKYSGTGLGLSIAQRLLNLMGTEVCVASEPGKGSTFSFDIEMRIASAHGPEPEWIAPMVVSNLKLSDVGVSDSMLASSHEEKDSSDTEPDSPEKTKVLVVEDYEANWMILMAHLKHLGYASDLAKNGKEAVECFQNNHYDLILMDIQMPEMDGLEATRIIRQIEQEHPEQGSIPIIAVTANTTDEDQQNCKDAGMDDFIAKPLTRKILFEKIEHHLSVDA
jgi:PAS domain S-box-containing protein